MKICNAGKNKINFLSVQTRNELEGAVQRNPAQGILLSGGIDSSLLAVICPGITAFTVYLGSFGSDRKYAAKVISRLGLKHSQKIISIKDALGKIPEVIKILRSFDPAMPNDLAAYFGLKFAKEKGAKSVMTGDGGDELFAGYSFMLNMDLKRYLPRMAKSMHFSTQDLGKAVGIKVSQPYMDKKFIRFALSIDPGLKVKKEGRKIFGKWILRKAFESDLPKSIIWQNKRPLEFGSGFTMLRKIIESGISDKEFREKSMMYPVKFLNKEHLYYYEIYRKVVGEVPVAARGQLKCEGCGAGMRPKSLHCRICGMPSGGWK